MQTGIVVPEMSDSKIIKLEDTATPTTEGELEGAEESLVMRKLLVSMQISEPAHGPFEEKESLIVQLWICCSKADCILLIIAHNFLFQHVMMKRRRQPLFDPDPLLVQ